MNNVSITGRLTRTPELKYTQGDSMAIIRYTLAVQRNQAKKEGKPDADFINCVAFGKAAEFASKYFKKGTKVEVTGRLHSDSYDKDGTRVYYTEVIANTQEFAESKAAADTKTEQQQQGQDYGEFMEYTDDDLPFN